MSQAFGKHLLKEFSMDESFINVNFGSYGSPPSQVREAFRKYQDLMDKNPEKWIRYEIFLMFAKIREAIAKFIQAETENIALIENASDGINAVLRSLLTKKGEKVLVFDLAYPMVLNTLEFLKDVFEIEYVKIVLDKETLNSDEKILEIMEKTIIEKGPFKLACFDHISSMPSLIFPIKEICKLCQKHKIISLIDGAHGVGHVHLNLLDLNPDFYLSNFHKWGFAPKSAAFLYASKQFQNHIHPNIIGNKYKAGFIEEFYNTGTRDYSSIFAIVDAINFIEKYNLNEIIKYNHNLAWEAGNEIAKIWKTELLITDKERIGSMINVRIPCENKDIIEKCIYKTLHEHNIMITFVRLNDGKFYSRFSAQIFNEISDYRVAAETFFKEIEKFK